MTAISDALTVFNTLTNFFFDLQILPGLNLGSMIFVVGIMGASITMITNYKGQG